MAETSLPDTTLRPVQYRCVAASTISLRLSKLEQLIPSARRLRAIEAEETVDLPADHILAHVVPTLSLRLLAELKPGLVEPCDEIIRLPSAELVAAYRLQETTEISPAKPHGFDLRADIPAPAANLGKILNPIMPPCEPHAGDPEPAEPTASKTHPPEGGEFPLPRRLADLIPNLPTLRRVTSDHPAAAPLALTRMPGNPEPESEILGYERLQALFLTDEKLSIKRVVELCGGLPGIRSCVLTHGNMVIASHNVPENINIVSLSSNASAMLGAMQQGSADMGFGDIPALTLHTAKGPLSIFQHQDLAMLVFHGDRGFIPGVREKMTSALCELTRSPLALPSAPENEGPAE